MEQAERSGSFDPSDPSDFWIDDITKERVDARTGERFSPAGCYLRLRDLLDWFMVSDPWRANLTECRSPLVTTIG